MASSLPDLMREHDRVSAIVKDAGLSHAAAARAISQIPGCATSEKSVRRARRALLLHTQPHLGAPRAVALETGLGSGVGSGRAEQTSDSVTFHGVVLDRNCQDAQDWTPIFAIFRLDPSRFEIVDDTVKIGTWQQSKGTEEGERDFIQLWSHSARFRRRSDSALSEEVLKGWRNLLLTEPIQPSVTEGARGTYTVLVADPQLGKKGTTQAIENWRRGVQRHLEAVRDLILAGRPPEAVHVAFQGDETEGVCNNYTNQPHTIELNLTAQLELDFDLRMWTVRSLASLGLPISVSSVISNHGEWTRNGGKDVVTTRGDNASTHIARQMRKVFDEMVPFGGPVIDWHIGGAEPGVVVNLSGVDCYFSHGYIEKGKGGSTEIRTKSAIERQILGRTETLGTVPLWFIAHYHHFYMTEFEGRTLFGCPALEAERSSEYMLDQYGVWSPPGMLGMLVDSALARGWSDLNVF